MINKEKMVTFKNNSLNKNIFGRFSRPSFPNPFTRKKRNKIEEEDLDEEDFGVEGIEEIPDQAQNLPVVEGQSSEDQNLPVVEEKSLEKQSLEEQSDPRKQAILDKLKMCVIQSRHNKTLFQLKRSSDCDYYCTIKQIYDIFFGTQGLATEEVLKTILKTAPEKRTREDMQLYFHFMPIANFGYDHIAIDKSRLFERTANRITDKHIMNEVEKINWQEFNEKYVEEFDAIAKRGYNTGIMPAYRPFTNTTVNYEEGSKNEKHNRSVTNFLGINKGQNKGGFKTTRRRHKKSKKKMYKKRKNNKICKMKMCKIKKSVK